MTREEAIVWCDRFNNAWANADPKDDFPDLKYSDSLDQLFYLAGRALRQQELLSNSKVVKSSNPLTLDELRKMDGEPVWIKLFDPAEEFWVLRNEWVDTRNPEPMILLHMRWYSHADYGKTWLAYREEAEAALVGKGGYGHE
ncbi:MAG: hypothetical protein SO072_01730 [Dysosmobacter sp.]|nr:hypothetical protein [Dysosmobacter sp.]